MANHNQDNDATPKAMPNSSRHETETAVHDPRDEHQTEAAKESARLEVAKDKDSGPESHGERR